MPPPPPAPTMGRGRRSCNSARVNGIIAHPTRSVHSCNFLFSLNITTNDKVHLCPCLYSTELTKPPKTN